MADAREIAAKLEGPLRLEGRSGFKDSAVVGGLGAFVREWAGQGAALEGSSDIRSRFEELVELFSAYGGADPDRRKEDLERGREILEDMISRLGPLPAGPRPRAMQGDREPAACFMSKDVQYLKGVGPDRARLLARMGVSSREDLLYHFPRRHDDRSRIVAVADAPEGEVSCVRCRVRSISGWQVRRGMHILRARMEDASGAIEAVWFNQPYLEKQFQPGTEIVMSGPVERFRGRQLTNPVYEITGKDDEDLIHTGRIVPVYRLTEGLSQRWLRGLIRRTLDASAGQVPEPLPASLRARLGLTGSEDALKSIHFPGSEDDCGDAYRRLVFDEFFLFQLIMARRRAAASGRRPGRQATGEKFFGHLLERLGFSLTGDQERVIAELRKDMASKKPMNRLVQGEVGSGKTLVAAAAMLVCAEAAEQSALLAPTEILAEQHFLTLQGMLVPLGLTVNLLIAGAGRETREAARREAADGSADVTVGTHALLEEDVEFKELRLAVVDEQHRFGVLQREVLRRKGGSSCDLLVLTATPIPRTLALTVFGDMDISTIRELPEGRVPVETYWVGRTERGAAYGFAKEEIRRGRQVFCVAPRLEQGDDELRAATDLRDELAAGVFRGLAVGLVHGRLKAQEKDSVMRDFRDGKLQALVATSVIEVGIDVPNATVMVIENAERFGLAQLHQIRGRVGRGEHQSYCMLIGDPGTGEGRRRLEVMTETTDGFEIAEEDLALRGPGQFLGLRQHGLLDIRIGDLKRDMRLLEVARDEARRMLEADPGLDRSEHRLLLEKLGQFEAHVAASP